MVRADIGCRAVRYGVTKLAERTDHAEDFRGETGLDLISFGYDKNVGT